ncbi:MAG: AbrB family transcriptional regulator [Devosia sp.]|uniref:AbrB family transcriptional regulator n=1 Tax=Devosia sp. TaxID=1871048 RepID=UPI00260CDA66|nr:AbrB family transcriptional regulator [Devosia sp.]MDB5540454.1 AbrB family transcriptional regulator [Devosia sp.]
MARLPDVVLTLVTLAAATVCGFAFHALQLPLAFILGSMLGSGLVANLLTRMHGGHMMRRGGQLIVGASIGAVMHPQVIVELVGLLPLMVGVALASNLMGLALALPIAWVAGTDRATAVLACLPAGMSEMATLARELGRDEQAVATIHTLRVIMILSFVAFWLELTAPTPVATAVVSTPAEPPYVLFAMVVVAGLFAAVATRLRVTNAWAIAPMLLGLLIAAAGFTIPAMPQPVLVAAQIAIGASLGLRFRVDQFRRLPRVAFAGVLSGLALIATAFLGLSWMLERLSALDHASAMLAVAPGGLGEMIAAATTLGLLAATIAGFQITRSLMTNLFAPPLIRWAVGRRPEGPAPVS